MGRGIVKFTHEGVDYFCEWSTVVDAPVTYLLTLKELKAYYKEEYGRYGMRGFKLRMERVMEKGTSFHMDASMEETISCNRAGDKEKRLTAKQIIKKYRLDILEEMNAKERGLPDSI